MNKMKTQTNRLVVADSSWAETIPDWIKEEIKEERLIHGVGDIINGTETVGDAEVLAYLYTLNLKQNVSHEISQIYFYLCGKVMKKSLAFKNKELPDFIKKKLKQGLVDDEERQLKELKYDLYRIRGGKINSPLLNILRAFSKRSERKRN